ncbi:MAG: class I SAM-dependent methyltransferase [Bdellovibrionales bacterium]
MGVPHEYWDEAYRDKLFLSQWDYKYPSQELIGALTTLKFETNSNALDLGCGGGRDAVYLAQNGFTVTGIDLSPEAISIAAHRAAETNLKISWLVANALALPFSNQSFDLVTDRACFHHIPDCDRPKYVHEVTRILKPGGYLIIRGSRFTKEDSFYEVSEKSIHTFFSKSDFSIGTIFPIYILNNAGGLSANMVLLKRL